MRDLILPAFEMDCRDWLVATPSEAGLPDEVAGVPLLVVLSTVVIDGDEFCPAGGVITVGLLGAELPCLRSVGDGCVAAELLDECGDEVDTARKVRYVLPAPGSDLALLAEFTLPELAGASAGAEIVRRVEALMASFRWATGPG